MECKQTPRAKALPGNNNFYAIPMVNVGGIVRPMHAGETVPNCFLDVTALAAAVAALLPPPADSDNQTLQLAGNVLSISGGNNVTLPAVPLTLGAMPTLMQDADIPVDVVGNDTYLLAAPAQWANVVVNGVPYVTPLYPVVV